jgi:hypothetical protein
LELVNKSSFNSNNYSTKKRPRNKQAGCLMAWATKCLTQKPKKLTIYVQYLCNKGDNCTICAHVHWHYYSG